MDTVLTDAKYHIANACIRDAVEFRNFRERVDHLEVVLSRMEQVRLSPHPTPPEKGKKKNVELASQKIGLLGYVGGTITRAMTS